MASNSFQVENLYALLGVPDFAELEITREAYKRLALLWHPDKNPSANATEEFQKLAVAWETLRDPIKRAEYDRRFALRSRKRGRVEDNEFGKRNYETAEGLGARKRPKKEERSEEQVEYHRRILEFRKRAGKDYLARLTGLTGFRTGHVALIIESRRSLRRQELALKEQSREDDSDILKIFSEAVERIPGRERTGTLNKLILGRKKYIENLVQNIAATRFELENMFSELNERTRSYEEAERVAREVRIREALQLAGARDLSGRKDRAITAWNALSRVKSTVSFSDSLSCKEPWHQSGTWERTSEEVDCDRCGQPAYHMVPECGPAKCPGCDMVVCHTCHRDLHLLREYEAWLLDTDSSQKMGKSPFSLDFEAMESIDPFRVYGNNFGLGRIYDDEL